MRGVNDLSAEPVLHRSPVLCGAGSMEARSDRSGAVIAVSGARGFVIAGAHERRYVVTAAHCLPEMPPAQARATPAERTYAALLGPLMGKRTIFAECLFADPVADIAVLGSPDGQALFGEARAYEDFIETIRPMPIGDVGRARPGAVLPTGEAILGRPAARMPARLLSLDSQWFGCTVQAYPHGLFIGCEDQPLRAGMSGSPILSADGNAIGVLSVSGGLNPFLARHLPGWLLSETMG